MKKYILIITASLLLMPSLCAQNNYLYNTSGDYVYFNVRNNVKYVKFTTGTSIDEKNASINALSLLSTDLQKINDDTYRFTVENSVESLFMSTVWNMTHVEYCSNLIASLTDTSFRSWTKNKLFVDLKQNANIVSVLEKCDVDYTDLLQWDSHNPRYIVTLQRGDDPISIANQVYETGLVHYAIPVFCIENAFQNVRYPQQWGLCNTGQNGGMQGVDINVVPAWGRSSGQGITIAIIDNGVELDHPDLEQNIVWGYGSTPDCLGGSNGGDPNSFHGTRCAGIAAARDNAIGIKGVAYNAKIMPVRVGTGDGINMDEAVLGIKFAYENGADVLNCSFGIRVADNGLPSLEMLPSLQAIENARTLGRNEKGCVVVCSSGNDNDDFVHIPANQDGFLSVGAVDRCGFRSRGLYATKVGEPTGQCEPWGPTSAYKGSCYGVALDVVAPGTACYTTELDGEDTLFNGTSAACPHVSGVAALVLSANPGLNESEVRNIICSTANKNRNDQYTYSDNQFAHPLGSWNNFMGYGLVNASGAVTAATNYDLYIRDYEADDGREPSCSTYSSLTFNSPDIWLRRNNDGGTFNQGINFGAVNYVYVRVHNRGSISSSPNDAVKLFKGHAGSHMDGWSAIWDDVGTKPLPSIPAGGCTIVYFPIFFPSYYQYGVRHFPLLAQIVSENDGLQNLSTNAALNAYNHNNIAIENVSTSRVISLYEEPTSLAADTYISNDDINALNCDIRVKFLKNQLGKRLTERAEIRFILSEELKQCFALSSMLTVQGASLMNDSTFKILDTVVFFNNVTLPGGSVCRFTVQANCLTSEGVGNEEFHINLLQTFEDDDMFGGSDLEVFSEERELFYANAGEDVLSERNGSVTLRAEGIGEPATYRWFNQNGSLVHSGQEFQVVATSSSSYKLEVTANSDGYRDYDTVNVNLIAPHIISIVPNPASQNTLTVYVSVSDSSNVQLLVTNAYSSNETLGTFPVNTGAVSSNMDITNFPQGVYSVSLVVDGVIADTKNFVRVR